eukprot:CAMPEP_0174330560 /NCGR_PEP_ID=MMETSP0810-20121108/16782_1 /TAXON_ID=73025 ORGANISM="Eutreptiella gymnastica-like, Strain CCMP1594" /NCGR_SAMPLE_ID=MMETSP0810 /ASSEMBLY_ACC=CAM_ASM_000659 /LENGTH=93 /DNA_ID=CAMNT_0015445815 /DNA_START=350 /DNA_END=627 /DNA_ORIENTATION=+
MRFQGSGQGHGLSQGRRARAHGKTFWVPGQHLIEGTGNKSLPDLAAPEVHTPAHHLAAGWGNPRCPTPFPATGSKAVLHVATLNEGCIKRKGG